MVSEGMTPFLIIRKCLVLLSLVVRKLMDRIYIRMGFATETYGIYNAFDYKGMWFSSTMHSPERTVAAEKYDRFRPDDVLVATYPKTGTHFIYEILASIYRETGRMSGETTSDDTTAPLEINQPKFMNVPPPAGFKEGPVKGLEGLMSPRVIVSHMAWDCLPLKAKEGKVKVIHCTRNPKDVLCSMYPYYKKIGFMSSSVRWEDFVQWYTEGNVVGGCYFKYLRGWYPYRNNTNVLNITFENLKKDLKRGVEKIAKFMDIELTEKQLEAVVFANTFANRVKVDGGFHPVYRKGKSGGWKSEITVAQNEMLDEWIQDGMKGLDDFEIKYQ